MTTIMTKITSIIVMTAVVSLLTTNTSSVIATSPSFVASWSSDTEICYLSDELDDIDADGTNNSAAIENEFEKSRIRYDTINGLTIDEDTSTNCSGTSNDIGSTDQGWWSGTLATAYWSATGGSFNYVYIDFNNAKEFGIDSNHCSLNDWDIEWVMNHEMGHFAGMEHHSHYPWEPHSVMYASCNDVWEVLQTDDINALNSEY